MSLKRKARRVTFLEASVPLSKTFTKKKNGEIVKSNYPMVAKFTSHEEQVENITDLYDLMCIHAGQAHCMIKGNLSREINKERRAGLTTSDEETFLFLSDLDGLPLESVPAFINLLPTAFKRKSYILQYSASHGIGESDDGELRVHLFHWLRTCVSPLVIKKWLYWFNLTTPELRSAITLSASGTGLRWPLDVSVNGNDKLVYMAPPKLVGDVPVWDSQERIQLKKGKADSVEFDFEIPWDDRELEQEKLNLLKELRKEAGLSDHNFRYTHADNRTISSVPEGETWISDYKVGPEFTHCNLNGGDSGAYYYRSRDPYYIDNFKNGISHRLKEVDKEHWKEAMARARELNAGDKPETEPKTKPARKKRWGGLAPIETEVEKREDLREDRTIPAEFDSNAQIPAPNEAPEGTQPFVFIDRETGDYYRGLFFPTGAYKHWKSKNLHLIKNFQKTWGMDTRDEIEEWDVVFDPKDNREFHPSHRKINKYQMSDVMRKAQEMIDRGEAPDKLPPVAYKVISSCTGDKQSLEWSLNWTSCVVVYRDKTTTAIVLQGTYGTGKGLFMRLLELILGPKYVIRVDLETFGVSEFNGATEQAILIIIDEADMDAVWGNARKRVHKKLKESITESPLTIRNMYSEPRMAPSFCNLAFLANEKHVAHVSAADRRYTVCARQDTPLEITDEEVRILFEEELLQVAAYFMSRKADMQLARTPLDNAARRFVQQLSMDSNEEVFEAIIQGDFQFFIDSWPDEDMQDGAVNSITQRALMTYREAMIEVYDNRETGRISRKAIESLVWHLTGNKQATAHKATKWINHHGLDINLIRMQDGPVRGYEVKNWKISEGAAHYLMNECTKEEKLKLMRGKVQDELEKAEKTGTRPKRKRKPRTST